MKRDHDITPRSQRGIALLEALISIVILSLGVLAIIGLQATAVRLSSDGKYRSDAALAANQLVGQMLSDNRAALTGYQTGGAAYDTWRDGVMNRIRLPGVGANPPTVQIVTANGVSTITITVFWQAPGEIVHQHRTVTQIASCTGVCL